jgi:hypothetical protein
MGNPFEANGEEEEAFEAESQAGVFLRFDLGVGPETRGSTY